MYQHAQPQNPALKDQATRSLPPESESGESEFRKFLDPETLKTLVLVVLLVAMMQVGFYYYVVIPDINYISNAHSQQMQESLASAQGQYATLYKQYGTAVGARLQVAEDYCFSTSDKILTYCTNNCPTISAPIGE